MPKSNSGLSTWFKEEWVDLSRPKPGGGFEPCGRSDAKEGKYPKCVPKSKAAAMTQEQVDSAIRRKRLAESTRQREGKKPINVSTMKKASKNVPTDPALYSRVKAQAKRKFDVYPSAYANGWLVQEYKRRGGRYKTVNKGDFPGHPFRGNQWTQGKGGTTSAARLATGKTLQGKGSPEQLKAMALDGGFTYNPKRNEIRAVGVASAIDQKYELKVSASEFEANGEQIIKDYVRKNSEMLAEPLNHLGAWRTTTPTSDDIYLDVSVVKPTVKAAADIGRANNQLGIFDLSTFTEYGRHKSPTTGEYKYLPLDTKVRGNRGIIDRIGKAAGDKGVMLIPAETIDETTIPEIVQRILALPPIKKRHQLKKIAPVSLMSMCLQLFVLKRSVKKLHAMFLKKECSWKQQCGKGTFKVIHSGVTNGQLAKVAILAVG